VIVTETKLKGAFVLEPKRFEDERGFFARNWSRQELAAHGLDTRIAECNISFNRKRGTLRGMHYQAAPHGQVKIVRCTMGAIYDVIIDLRPDSVTYRQWLAVELTAQNRLMLYIPVDFAHGFQTLLDDTEVSYQMSSVYAPASERAVRWDDPAFGISWPEPVTVMNTRDRSHPDFVGALRGEPHER
jgi:dTDP-4-dehydrorhamnose 3,5-epimerase